MAEQVADFVLGRLRILVAKSAQEGGQSQDIWEIREGGLGSTAFARRVARVAAVALPAVSALGLAAVAIARRPGRWRSG